MSSDPFSSLPLSGAQLANLESLGYSKMTPVQAKSLPPVLAGKDVIVRAKTGSGKTAAFGIGLLENINPRFFGVQVLVLCPTRELADQVAKELRRLARSIPNLKLVVLCGGKPFGPQRDSLAHGAHVIVGTPGRIQDHLTRKTLKLDQLQALVLDEADRMLDMGFLEPIRKIIKQTPKSRQTLLFSATYPDSIRQISQSILRKPVTVSADTEHKPGVIEQVFYEVRKHERNNTLLAIFEHYQPENALVFCYTKKQCDEVAGFLRTHNIQSLALHGDLDQRMRDQVLVQFANNSCPVLVATDVAARGLDIKQLQVVINYELPRDSEIYVHRIGRTGRAGEKGLALSIFTASEQARINAIEDYLAKPCICDAYESLDRQADFSLQATMVTIQLDTGKKNKIRPGDILGALTGDAGLAGSQVGKIDVLEQTSYVAIERAGLRQALNYLSNGKIKGRSVRARRIR
jgi:ATP-independent RNA helicase DbpA